MTQYTAKAGGTAYQIEIEPNNTGGVKAVLSSKKAGSNLWKVIRVQHFDSTFFQDFGWTMNYEKQWIQARRWALKTIELIGQYAAGSNEVVHER